MLTEKDKESIIKEKDLLKKSILLIEILFKDVTDKQGKPYIGHLKRTGNRFTNNNRKVIGYLHDTIEDTSITKKELMELGFTKEIVDAVEIVSKKENEEYNEFINRIITSNNIDAILVKRSDIKDNMNMKRIKHPTERDYTRAEKYRVALEKIENDLRKRNKTC